MRAKPIETLKQFLRLEAAGGVLLVIAAGFALVLANSPWSRAYQALLELRVAVIFGTLSIDKALLLWVNDGLMAVFFLLVGLEIKREVLEGELSSREQVALPAVAAVAGFVVPAFFYWFINRGDAAAMNGWAIPAATDIAFALGVLGLLGTRAPLALKVFLTTVAIVDDLMAIVVIALFYTADLSVLSLALAGGALVGLIALNRFGVTRTAAYILVGVAMWIFVLKSGVHATLAGVLVALTIPLRRRNAQGNSPARHLEHTLHPWVAFGILPVFAFANAGVSFAGLGLADLFAPVPLGIMLGLFVGKQLGIFTSVWLMIKLGFAKRPAGSTWLALYGVSMLCGIGFTMSLFIGSLAFEHGGFEYAAAVRLGVLSGSLLSAVFGYLALRLGLPPATGTDDG